MVIWLPEYVLCLAAAILIGNGVAVLVGEAVALGELLGVSELVSEGVLDGLGLALGVRTVLSLVDASGCIA